MLTTNTLCAPLCLHTHTGTRCRQVHPALTAPTCALRAHSSCPGPAHTRCAHTNMRSPCTRAPTHVCMPNGAADGAPQLTHTLVQGCLCRARRCPPCRGAPLRVPASHRRAHGCGEAMRDLEARNKLNCHGNAAPWTDFSQDTARLGADVRAAPAPAARWQGQAGRAGSRAPRARWGRAPRHGSARLSGTSRKSWLSKEAWRSRRGSGAGRAARSGDSAFTSFHSTHRVVSTATAGRTGAASAPPSPAGWRLRAGSLGQPSLAPHETGHNSWQGSFLPPAALRCG